MDSELFDVAFLLVVIFTPLVVMAIGAWRIDHPRQNRKLPYLWKTAGNKVKGILQ